MNPVVTPVKDALIVYALTDEDRKRLRNVKLISGGGDPQADFAFHRMCIQQTVEMLTQRPEAWEARGLVKEINKIEKELSEVEHSISPFGLHTSPREEEQQEKLRQREQELDQRSMELRLRLDDLSLSASPICVSPEINNAMVHLNDRKLSPQQRGRLKSLVETIMNTCPVKRTVRQYKNKIKPDKVEEKPYTRAPGFGKAEKQRRAILNNIHTKPFNEALKLIEEAAAVYKVTEAGLPGSEGNPIVTVTVEGGKNGGATDAPTS